jgi:hypothetical protein
MHAQICIYTPTHIHTTAHQARCPPAAERCEVYAQHEPWAAHELGERSGRAARAWAARDAEAERRRIDGGRAGAAKPHSFSACDLIWSCFLRAFSSDAFFFARSALCDVTSARRRPRSCAATAR